VNLPPFACNLARRAHAEGEKPSVGSDVAAVSTKKG
jgi:hypothetical protein